jgi:hypothetical protein
MRVAVRAASLHTKLMLALAVVVVADGGVVCHVADQSGT